VAGANQGQEIAVSWMTGWAYLIAFLITTDALLLALWLVDKDWPKHWRKKH
jgi:hypothetical protein